MATPIPYTEILKFILAFAKIDKSAFTNKDREVYRLFLKALTGYRMLVYEIEAEYAGGVIDSTNRLRALIEKTIQDLPTNSKIISAIYELQSVVQRFESDIKKQESKIREEILRSEEPHGNKIFLDHWKKLGYPKTIYKKNESLRLFDIWPEGFQISFIRSLEGLRYSFGLLLNVMCVQLSEELPTPLASLTLQDAEQD